MLGKKFTERLITQSKGRPNQAFNLWAKDKKGIPLAVLETARTTWKIGWYLGQAVLKQDMKALAEKVKDWPDAPTRGELLHEKARLEEDLKAATRSLDHATRQRDEALAQLTTLRNERDAASHTVEELRKEIASNVRQFQAGNPELDPEAAFDVWCRKDHSQSGLPHVGDISAAWNVHGWMKAAWMAAWKEAPQKSAREKFLASELERVSARNVDLKLQKEEAILEASKQRDLFKNASAQLDAARKECHDERIQRRRMEDDRDSAKAAVRNLEKNISECRKAVAVAEHERAEARKVRDNAEMNRDQWKSRALRAEDRIQELQKQQGDPTGEVLEDFRRWYRTPGPSLFKAIDEGSCHDAAKLAWMAASRFYPKPNSGPAEHIKASVSVPEKPDWIRVWMQWNDGKEVAYDCLKVEVAEDELTLHFSSGEVRNFLWNSMRSYSLTPDNHPKIFRE